MKQTLFQCSCHETSHIIQVEEGYINIILNNFSFFERLKRVFMYIFLNKTDYSVFSDWLLTHNEEVIDEFSKRIQENTYD